MFNNDSKASLPIVDKGDYKLYLENTNLIFEKEICSSSKSWNRRDICISASLIKPQDNTDYDSHNIEHLVNLAKDHYSANRLKSALNILDKILSNNSSHKEAVEYYNKIVYGYNFPECMLIEPTNMCTMGCPSCTRGGPIGYMTIKNFNLLINEVSQYVKNISLYFRGDSFHHPEIYNMLAVLDKQKHINIYISTNGNFQMDIDTLVKYGKNLTLDFSIDGATQEAYQQYRRNGNIAVSYTHLTLPTN